MCPGEIGVELDRGVQLVAGRFVLLVEEPRLSEGTARGGVVRILVDRRAGCAESFGSERERALGGVCEPLRQSAKQPDARRPLFRALGDHERVERVLVGQVQSMEQLASGALREPFELLGRHALEVAAHRVTQLHDVDLQSLEVKGHRLTIGDHSPHVAVESAAQLAQAPSQAPACVRVLLPQRRRQPRSAVRTPGAREVREQGTSLPGGRQLATLLAIPDDDLAQKLQSQLSPAPTMVEGIVRRFGAGSKLLARDPVRALR